jgi:hypothetical protein
MLRSDHRSDPLAYQKAARWKGCPMKPAAPALRTTLFLLCGVAALFAFSGDADAQSDDDCPLGTPSTVGCERKYMITDAQLNEAIAYNSPSIHLEKIFHDFSAPDPEAYAAAKKRLDGVVRHTESQAAEMGIASPVMYVTAINTQAAQTREGTAFLLINKNAFRLAVLTDEGAQRMKMWISRELARIRNGDTSPSAIAQHHNDPANSREAALRADLEGAGPLGAKDPIAATAAIQYSMREDLQARLMFVKRNTVNDIDPNRLSDRDYKRISDEYTRVYYDSHAFSAWDRIMALRKEARLMSEYEQTHAVRSHADRETESKWVVDQILRDTK